MTWSEFLSSQLFGIILGALLTGGFTCFIEWRKSVTEQKLHLRAKREETYQRILLIYYRYLREQKSPIDQLLTEIPKMHRRYYPDINIWGSKKVKDIYNKAMKSEENNEDLLIKEIRKELRIKD